MLVVLVLLMVLAFSVPPGEADDFATDASEACREAGVPGTVRLPSESDDDASAAVLLVRSVLPFET